MRLFSILSCLVAYAASVAIPVEDVTTIPYAQCGYVFNNAKPLDHVGLRSTNETDCHAIERQVTPFEATNYHVFLGCFCQFFRACAADVTPCGMNQIMENLEGEKEGSFGYGKTPGYFRCWAPKCVGMC